MLLHWDTQVEVTEFDCGNDRLLSVHGKCGHGKCVHGKSVGSARGIL